MHNNLTIDLIINRQKYSKIYNFNLILLVIILIITYVIFTYKYQTYYLLKGRMINHEIELFVPIDEISFIQNEKRLLINNIIYTYKITRIDKELYIDSNLNNCCYLYLKVNNLNNLDNFVYDIKIPKENKTLAKYLKDYF